MTLALQAIYITSLIVLIVVPVVFIWNHVYQDGVVGRIALGTIALVSSLVIYDTVTGSRYEPHFSTVAIIAAFALFLSWHLFRFHRRIMRRPHRRSGDPDNMLHTG